MATVGRELEGQVWQPRLASALVFYPCHHNCRSRRLHGADGLVNRLSRYQREERPNTRYAFRASAIAGHQIAGVLSPASPWRLPRQKPPCATLYSVRCLSALSRLKYCSELRRAANDLAYQSIPYILNFNLLCSIFFLRISRSGPVGRVVVPIKGVGPRNPRPPSQHLSPFLLLCYFVWETQTHCFKPAWPYGIFKSPSPAALTLLMRRRGPLDLVC